MSMSSKYAKQKSKCLRTSDLRYENILGREQIPKGVTFQFHFPLVVNAVLCLISGWILIWCYPE